MVFDAGGTFPRPPILFFSYFIYTSVDLGILSVDATTFRFSPVFSWWPPCDTCMYLNNHAHEVLQCR